MRCSVLMLLALAACAKKDAAVAPAASAVRTSASADAGPNATIAAVDAGSPGWPSALPVPPLPAPAPIAVDGYPAPLRTCLPDPAYLAGFTTDGAEFGYCEKAMGTRCELVDHAGHMRGDSAGGPDSPPADAKREAAIDKTMRARGIPELVAKDCQLLPNPLRGTFRYGDIRLKVLAIEGSVVKVGGSVAGEPPVFPFIYSRPTKSQYTNGTELNVLALSPDETEIGLVTHTNCMEWCDEFEVVRMPVERFAAWIYNDAGFRAYKAKDFGRARDLFLRAAYIDASRDLPAYNLGCVYARQADAAHANAALALAIARGGNAVRARARADADFDAFKESAWFTTLTAQ